MIRTFKRDESGRLIAYHEVWVEPENRRIIEHWGPIGEVGDTRAHRARLIGSVAKQVDALLAPARADGFTEIDEGAFKVVCVEYKIDAFGDEDDLEKRHALYDRLNEILGWTGLGYCDGGSTGSGTMESACFVVDVDLAIAVIKDGLEDTEFADFSRIYQE